MSTKSRSESENFGLTSPSSEAGQIEVRRTYLGLRSPSQFRAGRPPACAATLVQLSPCTVAQWRSLYAEIGGPWNWHDRDVWTDHQLAEHLANSAVSVFHVRADTPSGIVEPAGFLELEIAADQSVEIVYLGLHSRVFGLGLGAWLLGEAVGQAFAIGASRVWLHTCTLDSPAALPNYLARGFVAEREETYFTRLAG